MDVSPAVPGIEMNVGGATQYVEPPEETAAGERRITRTLTRVSPNRGIRFGASSHVAHILLGAPSSRRTEPITVYDHGTVRKESVVRVLIADAEMVTRVRAVRAEFTDGPLF